MSDRNDTPVVAFGVTDDAPFAVFHSDELRGWPIGFFVGAYLPLPR